MIGSAAAIVTVSMFSRVAPRVSPPGVSLGLGVP